MLIEQELSEDSSDEEYKPNDEEQEQVYLCFVLLQNAFTYRCLNIEGSGVGQFLVVREIRQYEVFRSMYKHGLGQ
jgi:hypothetical protein